MIRMIVILTAAALVLFPRGLPAGEGNYRDYIVGDRAAGMGGAAIALAVSTESCFYNPGGLARTKNSTVSLSASIYGISTYRSENGWATGQDIDVASFLVIPTAFGSVWKLDESWVFALSAFVPDLARSNDLEAYPSSYDFYKYNKDDQSVWLGPSLAYRVNETCSLGISVFGVYRTFSWFRDVLRQARFSWSEDIKYNDLSLLAVFGAHYQLDPRWSFGFTIQPPSIHLSGSGEMLRQYDYGVGTLVNYVDDADTENTIPAQAAAGVAWSEPGKWALALDLIYHFSADYDRLKGEDQFGMTWHYQIEYEPVLDFSLGGEYYITERYPVRAGFFTSLSSAPASDPETSWYPAHINKYGLTCSIGRETENTSFNLGVNYSWGSGDFTGWDEEGTLVKVDARETFLYVFAGTAYFF